MNKQLVPVILPLYLGSIAASDIVAGVKMPLKFVVTGAKLMNSAALAQSDTDYAIVKLKYGSTVFAQFSTKVTAGNGPLADNVSVDLVLTTAVVDGFKDAACVIPKDSEVVIDYTKGGTGSLTAAQVALVGYWH